MKNESGKNEWKKGEHTRPVRVETPQDSYGFGAPCWKPGELPMGSRMTMIDTRDHDKDPKTVKMIRGNGSKIY